MPLLFFLSILFCLRLIALYYNKTDLFFDEAQYWAWSENLAFGYFSKPPFLAWSIRSFTELCGTGEFCIRAVSPFFHTLTAIFIYLAARALYDSRTGFWSALAFTTIPGVSLSASLVSTDVPLLTFWSLALWAFIEFEKSRKWQWSVLFGITLGLGLLSKYAMAFFLLGLVVYTVLSPGIRWIVTSIRFWLSILIALIVVSPNLAWNLANGMVTFSHTADNANWKGFTLHPDKALEFFGAQFGVFGPVLFCVLLLITSQNVLTGFRNGHSGEANNKTTLLLSLSVPVILAITFQALLSRAHANWAATAYPAAAILVISVLLKNKSWKTITASFAVHLILFALLAIGTGTAGYVNLPVKNDPFARVLGWKELAIETDRKFREKAHSAIIASGRDITAELYYYLRGKGITLYSWKEDAIPRDYYQMLIPFKNGGKEDTLLLVTADPHPTGILRRFEEVEKLGHATVKAGLKEKRTLYYFSIKRLKSR